MNFSCAQELWEVREGLSPWVAEAHWEKPSFSHGWSSGSLNEEEHERWEQTPFPRKYCASVCVHYIFLQWGVQISVCCGNKNVSKPWSPFSSFRNCGCILKQISLFSRGWCYLCSPSTTRQARTPAKWGRPGERTAVWDCAHSLSSGPGGSVWSGTARDGGMWEKIFVLDSRK